MRTAQERHNLINEGEEGKHIGSGTAMCSDKLKRFCAALGRASKRNGAIGRCTEGQ